MTITWPEANRDVPDARVWADVARHCTNWRNYSQPGDLVTTAHECTHGVNSDIRNARGGPEATQESAAVLTRRTGRELD